MNFTPIIKPIGGNCNIDCGYCYFKKKKIDFQNSALMSEAILKELIDEFCRNRSGVEFVWHGGEPLLAGINFYRRAIKYQSVWTKKGIDVFNSMQTNGLLINEKWARFFSENNFSIGTSLDGPKVFHDKIRKINNKKGSFDHVMRAIETLRRFDIEPSIICCVSSVNCDHPKEIFKFFISEGIQKIKFLQVQGRDNDGKLLPLSVEPEKYADFLTAIFNELLELDDPSIEIREIESIVNIMMGGDNRECMFAGECHKYLTVYPDGAIYACDSLPQIESLSFGNIKDGLSNVLLSENFSRFKERMKVLNSRCISCRWHNVCRGGCPQDYWPNILDEDSRNLFCESLKKIFDNFSYLINNYSKEAY